MNNYDIIDLDLSGVHWEITDVPMAQRAKWATQPAQNTTPTQTQNGGGATNIARPSIVPPIAPANMIAPDMAVSMAARPTDIENLIRMIGEFNHPLRAGATNTVLPNIAPNPNGLVIISDVPGPDDDATGRILSGGAGDLLDKMLAAIEMGRENVSIIPIVFWRTPGGRTPTADELALTRPFIDRLLEFLQPKILLTLGATPAMEMAGVQLARSHGGLVKNASGMDVMSIYHPNYLMLKPSAKRDVWTALQELQKLLKNQ